MKANVTLDVALDPELLKVLSQLSESTRAHYLAEFKEHLKTEELLSRVLGVVDALNRARVPQQGRKIYLGVEDLTRLAKAGFRENGRTRVYGVDVELDLTDPACRAPGFQSRSNDGAGRNADVNDLARQVRNIGRVNPHEDWIEKYAPEVLTDEDRAALRQWNETLCRVGPRRSGAVGGSSSTGDQLL